MSLSPMGKGRRKAPQVRAAAATGFYPLVGLGGATMAVTLLSTDACNVRKKAKRRTAQINPQDSRLPGLDPIGRELRHPGVPRHRSFADWRKVVDRRRHYAVICLVAVAELRGAQGPRQVAARQSGRHSVYLGCVCVPRDRRVPSLALGDCTQIITSTMFALALSLARGQI